MARPRRQPRHGAPVPDAALARVAARLLAEDVALDFDDARRRAARELGCSVRGNVPDNRTIHRALAEYLALFQREALARRLRRLRRAALDALVVLDAFDARLCGPVWYGTACEHTPVSLHLSCDEVEAVTRFLLERRLVYRLSEAAFRFPGGAGTRAMPRFELDIGRERFELAVFPRTGAYRHPLSRLDDKPVKRVGARQLESLIESGRLFADDLAAIG